MRRILAILLSAVFSFSLISPSVFATDQDSKLPSCCRRNGKHACQMPASQSESSSDAAVRSNRCPFFSNAKAATAQRNAGLPGSFQAALGAVVHKEFLDSQTGALCFLSYT